MRQHAGRARFAIKTRPVFFALRAIERGGMDGFESDDAADGRVAGLEDTSHGAAAQFLDNLIPSNDFGVAHGEDCTNPSAAVFSRFGGENVNRRSGSRSVCLGKGLRRVG